MLRAKREALLNFYSPAGLRVQKNSGECRYLAIFAHLFASFPVLLCVGIPYQYPHTSKTAQKVEDWPTGDAFFHGSRHFRTSRSPSGFGNRHIAVFTSRRQFAQQELHEFSKGVTTSRTLYQKHRAHCRASVVLEHALGSTLGALHSVFAARNGLREHSKGPPGQH